MCRIWSGIALFCLTFAAHAEVVLSSPPRLTPAAEEKIYQPLAALLSKVIGEQVTYQHPGSYMLYQQQMRQGKYDIVLDGPAFIDWRMQRLGHVPVARLDGDLTFVVLVRRDNNRVRTLDDLTGSRVCSFPPPHLTALALLGEYPNGKIPRIEIVDSFAQSYQGVVQGSCEAGVLPVPQYQKLDSSARNLRPVFISGSLPNQAFTVSPRLARHVHAISAALAKPGELSVRPLLEAFNSRALVPAQSGEYRGMMRLLKREWGFD
jgi:ABC-type phosphate/phosphonate transport system substrate-binding protein